MQNWILTLGLCMAFGFAASPALSSDIGNLLKFIRYLEAGDNYDRYYAGISTPPPKPLTELTVGEVMAWQANLKNVKSTAAGNYQIIKSTLAQLVSRYGIAKTALFDEKMQDRLGVLLVSECHSARTSGGDEGFANCLATVWAALPLVSGPSAGLSAYDGIAGNRAMTTPVAFLAAVKGAPFVTPPPAKKGQANVSLPSKPAKFGVEVRYDRIKAETETVRKTGGLGKSVVFKTDPYAMN